MLRVVLRRARPDTEWSNKISGLQFNSALGIQESTSSRDATNLILTVPRTHRREEVELDVDEGSRTEHLNFGLGARDGWDEWNGGRARV
jgi:hypothetical protein